MQNQLSCLWCLAIRHIVCYPFNVLAWLAETQSGRDRNIMPYTLLMQPVCLAAWGLQQGLHPQQKARVTVHCRGKVRARAIPGTEHFC